MPIIETSVLALLIWAVLGYLFGSVPFGVLISRLMGLGDLRDIGSGNIGATNVLRTGSKPAAFATLVLDGAKGAIAALIARAMAGEDAAQVAGSMALIGHCYPIWLKFKGGKGVATFLGLLLALSLPVGAACCATWVGFRRLETHLFSRSACSGWHINILDDTSWLLRRLCDGRYPYDPYLLAPQIQHHTLARGH